MSNDSPRLPLEPLLEAFGGSLRDFRATVGSRHSVVQKAQVEGLDVAQADKYACRCGLHPLEVWGRAWEEALLCSS